MSREDYRFPSCKSNGVKGIGAEESVLVACGTAAGLVGMIECYRKLVDHWWHYGVMGGGLPGA